MKTICICGGGSLGHVTAGWIAAKEKAEVYVLTGRPESWQNVIRVATPEGKTLCGTVSKVGSDPAGLIPQADVVLFCYPGYMIGEELVRVKPYLRPDAYVGCVFSSTGFFFEAKKILDPRQPLWGFQRVPFISRVKEYGSSATLLGYKPCYHIAVENVSEQERQRFADLVSDWFERPVHLLNNFYEASLTNSNPLLHTSRLYTMFGGENEGRIYPRMIAFYEEWTVEAARMLIEMDKEFFSVLERLPVADDFLPTILDYYESTDAVSLAAKLSSIEGFKGIKSPMIETEKGWEPDFGSRYFTEDFPYGLKYIWQLAQDEGVPVPNIDMVYRWGISKIQKKGLI